MRRSVNVAYQCLLGLVVIGWFGVVAHADIALESYIDQRPLDAEHALGPLTMALERRRVVTKPAQILGAYASELPLPGNPDREVTRTRLIERIDRGTNLAAHEAFDEAVTILEGVFRDLANNPALAAADPESRSWVTKGRVELAFAYARSKRLALANDVVVEHIRSYPDVSLKGEQEEVERLYGANTALVAAGPRGRLVFRVNQANADIFVNEVERGRGTIEVNLVPGDYRIVVRATGVYRCYRVTIRPRTTVERSVDWSADAAFTATPDWIGFVGPRRARHSVTTFVRQLAQRAAGDAVLLIGIAQHGGRRYLTARRYAASSAPHRPGRAIELGGDASTDGIEALADYITAADSDLATLPARGLVAIPDDDELTGPAARTAAPARWPILAAVGVLGTSVPFGAWLVKTHYDCSRRCSRLTAPAGWGLLGLGGLALGFGIAWIVHGDGARSPPLLDIRPVPGGGMAYINGSF